MDGQTIIKPERPVTINDVAKIFKNGIIIGDGLSMRLSDEWATKLGYENNQTRLAPIG